MAIMLIVMAAGTMFFVVSMPSNEAYSIHDPGMFENVLVCVRLLFRDSRADICCTDIGFLRPIVTISRLALGDFDIDDYSTGKETQLPPSTEEHVAIFWQS